MDAAISSLDKDARIAELEAALAARDTLIDTLRFQLAQLRRMTFGQSSEKLSAQIEQLELTLEELEGEAAVTNARKDAPAAKPERPAPVRALPPHLPRAEQRIETELRSFTGLLQADGYARYEKLYAGNRIQEVACWAHFRRKIFENHQTSPTPLTTDLLERITALYRFEDEVRGQPPDVRKQKRQENIKPLVDELRAAIDDGLPPSSR